MGTLGVKMENSGGQGKPCYLNLVQFIINNLITSANGKDHRNIIKSNAKLEVFYLSVLFAF